MVPSTIWMSSFNRTKFSLAKHKGLPSSSSLALLSCAWNLGTWTFAPRVPNWSHRVGGWIRPYSNDSKYQMRTSNYRINILASRKTLVVGCYTSVGLEVTILEFYEEVHLHDAMASIFWSFLYMGLSPLLSTNLITTNFWLGSSRLKDDDGC